MDPYAPQQAIVPPPPQTDEDERHLRLLGIFHYVAAGFNMLGVVLGLIYVVVGIVVFVEESNRSGDWSDDAIGGLVLSAMAGAFTLLALAFACSQAYAGLSMQRQRRWTFCISMAIISCASMVLCLCGVPNLILGVFTLVVLLRPSVKARFGVAS